MLKGLRNIIRRPKPLRAIAKTLLLRTAGLDLGRHGMNIRVYNDFLIGLHPTTLTLSHWLNRTARLSDYQFLRQYLRPGDVYIDIGANIGTTVIPAARAVGHGRVIAFEPQPQIFCYLKNNLALNGIVNVSLHDWALGPENGELSFSTDRLDDRNRISDGGNTCVQVRTLDEFAGDLPAVAWSRSTWKDTRN